MLLILRCRRDSNIDSGVPKTRSGKTLLYHALWQLGIGEAPHLDMVQMSLDKGLNRDAIPAIEEHKIILPPAFNALRDHADSRLSS